MNKIINGSNELQKGPNDAISEENIQEFLKWYIQQCANPKEGKIPFYMEVDLRKGDYDILTIIGKEGVEKLLERRKVELEKVIQELNSLNLKELN